jgi:hypothetical protein
MKTSIRPSELLSRRLLAATAISLGAFAPSAHAYLDPSTGSMILSAIVGLFATAGLALKTYWYKMKSLFTGSRSDSSVSQDTAEETAPGEAGEQS